MYKRWMFSLAVVAGAFGTAAAFEEHEKEVTVKFVDVPAAVQKTLQEESRGATIDDVTKESENGKTVYEAEVKINGKSYNIEVAEDGTLLEKKLEEKDEEVEIKFSEAPAAVQKTLQREAGSAKIENVKKDVEDGDTTYEAEVKIDGRIYEIEVGADGILQEKKLKEAAEVAVKLLDCPAAVQMTLKREALGAAIDKVDKESRDGKPVYEADVKIDGKNYEILVAEDGMLISKALDEEEEEDGEKETNGDEDDDD